MSMRMKVFPLHLLNIGRNSFDMLEKFTVIDLIRTRSDSVATITGSAVKFNIQTAAELNYPAYVQFLIEQKNKQFAVRVCKEDAPNAVKFSRPKGEQKYAVKVTFPVAVDMIRKLMNWSKEENWKVVSIVLRKLVCRPWYE